MLIGWVFPHGKIPGIDTKSSTPKRITATRAMSKILLCRFILASSRVSVVLVTTVWVVSSGRVATRDVDYPPVSSGFLSLGDNQRIDCIVGSYSPPGESLSTTVRSLGSPLVAILDLDPVVVPVI